MFQRNTPNLQLFLDRLTRRSMLTRAEQDAVLGLPVQAIQAPAGRDFVRLHEKVDHACFIVDGLVGRFDQTSDGKRQITALHIAGDMPDLLSVVQPAATSALQALSTATILQVPHSALRAVAAQYPSLAEAFWRDCMVDSMILAQWVVNVGRRNAQARIAHLFCEMAVRYFADTSRPEIRYDLRMSQDQLADSTGLTAVHVNRSLMALREKGISFQQRTVRIEDWKRLTQIGDFDAGYLQADIEPSARIRIVKPAAL
jgi:CRP-like cAMP-binding protein